MVRVGQEGWLWLELDKGWIRVRKVYVCLPNAVYPTGARGRGGHPDSIRARAPNA